MATPLAIRYHNPGCIRKGNGYARYANLEEGYSALINLLKRRYHNKTALQIFVVYAPKSDGNNPYKYAAGVIKQLRSEGLNVNNNTKLNMYDPQILRALCLAISRTECSKALDPVSLDRALAKSMNEVFSQSALAAQTTNPPKVSWWRKIFSRKKTVNASPKTLAATPKMPPAVKKRMAVATKCYPALVKLYYNKLYALNAIHKKKTPKRWRQAQAGVINYQNIPHLNDKFENDTVQAMAATENAILSNADLPAQQQIQRVLSVAAQSMTQHILAKDKRCEDVLTMITGAAMAEIRQRQGKHLTPREYNKIYANARALVSNSSLKKNPQLFLAQCKKFSNNPDQSRLKQALTNAGGTTVYSEENIMQNVSVLKSQHIA